MKARLIPAPQVAITIALDQHVRGLLHQLAVLEGARLGLVGVADEVLGHVALGQERAPSRPSGSRRRRGRAGRRRDLARRSLGRHRERLAQRAVAAAALVHRERVQPRLVDVVDSRSVGCLVSAGGRSAVGDSRRGVERHASARAALEHRRRPRRSSTISARVARASSGPTYYAVDRRHRRDVARAEALEAAHVDLADRRRRPPRIAVVELVGAAQRAGDVRADVDACGGPPARARTCRRRSRPRSGRRASARITQATCSIASGEHQPWRSLGGVQRRDRRGLAVRVLRHRGLDLRAQLRRAPASAPDRGSSPAALVRSTASSQPGTREPCS